MKRADPNAAFSGVATPEAIGQYDPHNGPCCTENDFMVDLTGTNKSHWNQSAADIFATSFLNLDQRVGRDFRHVRKTFQTHLISLRRSYVKRQLEERARQQKRREASRAERKRLLFHRRLNIARKTTALQCHVNMLRRFGPAGMSSEESVDDENGGTQYRVLIKPWRSSIVTNWLRVFDAVDRLARQGPTSQRRKGTKPRTRFFSTKVGSHIAVRRLPITAYKGDWLLDLDEFDHGQLDIQDNERYEFMHTPDIQT
ncbi:hypothetical protein FA95DRAFT_1506202 [Auriscalpium vulgare]|uniref:Uncharacterized protein n=1 Tax=Auriscalpium vulgare TaxID=40419 RepID=A0ACB8R2H8_9AGAM|nr:hypothetical protein FA95DRAFT_1506202 [Auriscalpium vulgare]